MAAKREPWDDDSDSDFQSAASFELDDSEDEARGGRVPDDGALEWTPEHEAFADDDFHECVDGLLLDEGYFGEDAYRGPPGACAIADETKRPEDDRIAEADLERAALASGAAASVFGGGVAAASAEVVRDAMSRAAADAMLRGASAKDDDAEGEDAAFSFFSVHD